ncbi:hypothetical protein B484DRAFT_127558 [Ochromonadaceae sp. CCMP2298]|nr:hypothetical protein B484DRAFT_127558 [Ochromonadaceae sp. CCMP2298]
MAGATGLRYNFPGNNRHEVPESPLFERQMGNEEFVELQQLKLVIDDLQQRIVKLEKINVDLEGRLEDQAKQSMAVEKECLLIEQKWRGSNDELLKEIENWKVAFQGEKLKGDRLREQVHRTERELYGILQRKYELMRGGPTGGNRTGLGNAKANSNPEPSSLRRGENSHSGSGWDSDLFQTAKVRGYV